VATQLEGVHLVELSPTLRHVQHCAMTMGQVVREPVTNAPLNAATIQEARTPDGKPVRWHGRFKDVPAGTTALHRVMDCCTYVVLSVALGERRWARGAQRHRS